MAETMAGAVSGSDSGLAYNINMTYTDSASIKARLEAPVHLDFSHLSFKYSE